jgi:short-subunit dehydrogenase
VPILLQQPEAHVVNTASIAGLIPGVLGIYSVTKHAVVALSESLQLQLSAANANVGVSVLCPGWVRTRIGEAERNRPQRAAETTIDPQVAAMRRALIDSGSAPSEIAERVIEGIQAGRFYILPHPEWMSLVRERTDDIELGRPPRLVDLSAIQRTEQLSSP